ncbi:capu, partial [Symbiodinium microadriaticum]
EQHSSYDQALRDFLSVVECFQESEMLPNLLGIILAVGNYLNGGTNRGQADAFDLETFGKLEGIKDAAGKGIRHFIFDLFLNQMAEQASQFMEEITPCMININRRIAKDSDGVEKLDKSARIVFEDFDLCVNALHGDFVAKHETMQMILSYFEDPADPFKMQMPAIYAEAKEKLDALVTLKDTAKEKYAQLLKWFKIQTMKSSDFCVLWDNLMVPANLILNADVKMKKDFMIPTFCQNKAFTA